MYRHTLTSQTTLYKYEYKLGRVILKIKLNNKMAHQYAVNI